MSTSRVERAFVRVSTEVKGLHTRTLVMKSRAQSRPRSALVGGVSQPVDVGNVRDVDVLLSGSMTLSCWSEGGFRSGLPVFPPLGQAREKNFLARWQGMQSLQGGAGDCADEIYSRSSDLAGLCAPGPRAGIGKYHLSRHPPTKWEVRQARCAQVDGPVSEGWTISGLFCLHARGGT